MPNLSLRATSKALSLHFADYTVRIRIEGSRIYQALSFTMASGAPHCAIAWRQTDDAEEDLSIEAARSHEGPTVAVEQEDTVEPVPLTLA
jgi:hypothetical protein